MRIRRTTSGGSFAGSPIPSSRVIAIVTPKVTPPALLWLFGFVWMFWLRVVLHYTLLLLNLAPRFGGAAS